MSDDLERRFQFIDERCDRYEADWNSGSTARLQEYLEGVQAENRQALWYELVLLDSELRRARGETVTLAEYRDRCPDQAILLELSTDWIEQATSSSSAAAPEFASEPHATPSPDCGTVPGAEPVCPHDSSGGSTAEDLPSTIGEIEGQPVPDENFTSREDMPSTLAASGAVSPGQGGVSATEGWVGEETTSKAATLPTGSMLGDYELIAKLAQGGMGVVYKARQISLNRIVALKTIKGGAFASDREIRLFQSEAEAVAALDHPGIVPILEIGAQNGLRYYSMKLIDGFNLQECRNRFYDQPRSIAHLVAQIGEAIHHAHLRGVLHRDLKPANILIDSQNQPHVVDWGLAKRLEANDWSTTDGGAMGTPSYMAPEQAQGHREAITTATDVYGLGTILYALLTHRPPFQAGSSLQTLRLVIEDEPVRPRAVDSRIDGDLETICLKCLEKDPRKRYASARELADDLNRWLDAVPILARPVSTSERVVKWARRRPAIAALLATVLVVSIAGVSGIAWQWRQAVDARQGLRAALLVAHRNEDEAKRSEDHARHLAYAAKLNLAQRDWQDGNTAGVLRHLEQTGPELGKSDLRGFEWHYLERLCRGQGVNLLGHEDVIASVSYSPDGRRLASASWDGIIKIWDAATGHVIRTLTGKSPIFALVVHPDGTQLASAGSDRAVTLWDAATGQVIRTFSGHNRTIRELAFSRDGKLLASSSADGTIKLWDASAGSMIRTLADHRANEGGQIAFSPDGKALASAGGGEPTVRIWNLATGQLDRTLRDDASPAANIARGPDGKTLAGVERPAMARHRKPVLFSPDGKILASGTEDGTIMLRDASTGSLVRILRDHHNLDPVTGLAFSPDGRIIASISFTSPAVSLWDASTGYVIRILKGHTSVINDIAFSPDGVHLASAYWNLAIRILDATRDQEAQSLPAKEVVRDVAFGPDGSYLAFAGLDRNITLWDLAAGRAVRTFQGHTEMIFSIAISADGRRMASAGEDQSVRIWDLAVGNEIHLLKGHKAAVSRVAFSTDGKTLASASNDRTVKLWDVETGREIRSLNGHIYSVRGVAFSADGKTLASAGDDGFVLIWDLKSGRQLQAIKAQQDGVRSMALSPNGLWLATGGYDPSIKIWNVATGQELHNLRGHALAINEVEFSPDSRRLFSASDDRTIRIWDPAFGHEVMVLRGHVAGAWGLAVSPDGARVASAGDDWTVKLWEANIGGGRP
jgi:WD40 repeat protein